MRQLWRDALVTVPATPIAGRSLACYTGHTRWERQERRIKKKFEKRVWGIALFKGLLADGIVLRSVAECGRQAEYQLQAPR